MTLELPMSPAWYHASREEFCRAEPRQIVNQLAGQCAQASLDVEQTQYEEWSQSVEILRSTLGAGIPVLREALKSTDCESIRTVILEYDFRRRGLRIDCILLADGLVFVLEFKRSRIGSVEIEQVMRYAVNLLEFHEATRHLAELGRINIVPVLVSTQAPVNTAPIWPGLRDGLWPQLASRPLVCDAPNLLSGLRLGLAHRASDSVVEATTWIRSPFTPSSTIVDAAVSLYGGHDVVAVRQHSAAIQRVREVTDEVRSEIVNALQKRERVIVMVTGDPGAGKTLVGLDLVLRGNFAGRGVFVTGNAPLVDVLQEALSKSYRAQLARSNTILSGYRRADARLLAGAATFRIVKAHEFLRTRGQEQLQTDGQVLVFDEAQRTYRAGTQAAGVVLHEDEADLILASQQRMFPNLGTVVVALVGHNQAIGRSELGGEAWLRAAERKGWRVAIADRSLALFPTVITDSWRHKPVRSVLQHGHLDQSMRYYRNSAMADWVDAVLSYEPDRAQRTALDMQAEGDQILLARDLSRAKTALRASLNPGDRFGLVGSGQGRRLAAEGLFVDRKPSIADWMLLPEGDCRSSNALEEIQNQYQIQGLEIDGTIVCWDLDLRMGDDGWKAFKMHGASWIQDKRLDVATSGYRVLLTRARKQIVIFVPRGDPHGVDLTRPAHEYDRIASHLVRCGVKPA